MMPTSKAKRFTVCTICIVVVLVLGMTALDKLWHFSLFSAKLKMSPWKVLALHHSFFAWAVPITELTVSLLLLGKRTGRWGFAGAVVLFTVFSGYMLWIWIKNIKVACGCNEFIERMTVLQHVRFNLALLMFSLLGFLLTKRNSSKI
ncbi:MAG: hypothetical protein DI598_03090 [Pseudopedobacter saltans]|uniref:Methylamine utilisation protein MauE domain-containing protein n=1 Tax=Pseudopedobacter saltans TaxID=151895 RepID=A0A2W5F5X3_9SPHI|nr:MAG: hypothetical protein DI598_03090 [Pseudopedobacter saltans]